MYSRIWEKSLTYHATRVAGFTVCYHEFNLITGNISLPQWIKFMNIHIRFQERMEGKYAFQTSATKIYNLNCSSHPLHPSERKQACYSLFAGCTQSKFLPTQEQQRSSPHENQSCSGQWRLHSKPMTSPWSQAREQLPANCEAWL